MHTPYCGWEQTGKKKDGHAECFIFHYSNMSEDTRLSPTEPLGIVLLFFLLSFNKKKRTFDFMS